MDYIYHSAKVKFFLHTTCRPVGGVEVEIQSFVTLVLDGGEWLTSRPGRFILREVPLELQVWWVPEQDWVS
jgi:hypothetical protein